MHDHPSYPAITSKPEVTRIAQDCIQQIDHLNLFVPAVHQTLLQKKIRFPLLEHAALLIAEAANPDKILNITDKIIDLNEIGSYVIAGKILQERTRQSLQHSIHKAGEYMLQGNTWYACDILSERVMGHGLLTQPKKTIPILTELTKQSTQWLKRSVGVATHYATKKGLKKEYADEVFQLLLTLTTTTEYHTKTGIGWGAKTIAKFHPDIIVKYKSEIQSSQTRSWFTTKIKLGLSMNAKYGGKFNK